MAVGVGVAVLQPELIPGIAIGAAIALAPRYLPRMRGSFRSAGRWLRRASEQSEPGQPAHSPEQPEPTHH